jgi:hypothetical protein
LIFIFFTIHILLPIPLLPLPKILLPSYVGLPPSARGSQIQGRGAASGSMPTGWWRCRGQRARRGEEKPPHANAAAMEIEAAGLDSAAMESGRRAPPPHLAVVNFLPELFVCPAPPPRAREAGCRNGLPLPIRRICRLSKGASTTGSIKTTSRTHTAQPHHQSTVGAVALP